MQSTLEQNIQIRVFRDRFNEKAEGLVLGINFKHVLFNSHLQVTVLEVGQINCCRVES